jgi:transcriptional regulator with XRE-family HTH domain
MSRGVISSMSILSQVSKSRPGAPGKKWARLLCVYTSCTMESMLSLQTVPTPSPEQMRLYRKFLGLTQAQLAVELSTTITSVSRWESKSAPISPMTLAHLHRLVTKQMAEEISLLFRKLQPALSISKYFNLVGHPRAEFTEDSEQNLYFGSVFIDPGYRKHVLYLRADDREWYGLDKDSKAAKVDAEFLQQVIES